MINFNVNTFFVFKKGMLIEFILGDGKHPKGMCV